MASFRRTERVGSLRVSGSSLKIGSIGDGTGSRFDGVIDEVKLPNIGLTDDELIIVLVLEPSTYSELF